MTKITFIGAGSLGFTGELVRDILTFPLLEDATISLMDIHPERLEWAKKGVEKLIAAGNRPAKVEATLDRARSPEGRGRGADHDPGGQHRGLAARHRDPQKVRRGHQRGRHARTLGHLPLPAHDQPDAGHRARHGTPLPEGGAVELHQSHGDVVRRAPAADPHPGDGTLPLGAGHGDDAGGLDRRADGGDRLPVRGHQPSSLVSQVQLEGAGRLSAHPQGDHGEPADLQPRAGAQ